jgi:hypothetical protein
MLQYNGKERICRERRKDSSASTARLGHLGGERYVLPDLATDQHRKHRYQRKK